MVRPRTLWFVGALVALTLLASACGGAGDSPHTTERPDGDARSFAMGLSSLPSELTTESYDEAFARSAQAGEVILIRRAPPWEELLSGDFPSEKTAATVRRETELASKHDLAIFFAIDATNTSPETGQLAGLPPDEPGVGFEDERVRQALMTYAQYVTVNYQPQYLALGVDVNQYWLRNPAGFQQFVTLYRQIYHELKARWPDTKVFPTFQLEDLQGLLPLDRPHPPQWELVQEFAGASDLLAVSTYPGVVFPTAADIPADYYTSLEERADVPVAVAETGFASAAAGTRDAEAEQSAFVRRILRDAEEMPMALVIWFAGQDLTFSGQLPTDLVKDAGLLREDGTAKPAWRVWTEAAQRPTAPQG